MDLSYSKVILRPLSCALLAIFFVNGCKSPELHKQDADEQVYDIIESKWDEQIGSRYNYRVADTDIDPNDIDPAKYADVSGQLSLRQAVSIATAKNRSYQLRKENLYRSALDLTLVRHNFADIWFGTIDADYNNSTNETVGAGASVGFRRLFADGTRITSSIATDWVNYLTGSSNSSLGSVIRASISKPLLRGAGKDIVLENLTQSERDVLYEIRSFNRYRHEFVIDIIRNYYRVLQNLDGVNNARNNYENLVISYERAKMMAEAGRLPPFQADQTLQNMLRAEDSLNQAETRYQQSLDDFKLFLGISIESEITLDSGELDLLLEYGTELPDYSIVEAVGTARDLRLDLANSFDRLEDAKRKVKVAENALLADITLSGGANLASSGDTQAAKFDLSNTNYSAGLEVELPLDRLAERNAYRRSLLTLQQRQREYEEFFDRVELNVVDAFRRLNQESKRFEIQQMSMELAETRVDSTNMLFNAGRVASRELLEAQDALLRAQNDRTSAMVEYTMSKLVFLRDVGVLEVMPDGMWSEREIN